MCEAQEVHWQPLCRAPGDARASGRTVQGQTRPCRRRLIAVLCSGFPNVCVPGTRVVAVSV